jgi:hypothetical protein
MRNVLQSFKLGLRVLFVRLQMLLQSRLRLRRFRLRLQLGPGVALRGLPEFASRRAAAGHRRYCGQHQTALWG